MSWPIVTLGELALSVRNGMFASRPTDEPPGTRILRISAVRDGRVNNADSKFVANLMSDQIEKFSVRPGDLLVTRYNGSRSLVGISGIVPPHEDPIVYPDKLIRIVVDRSLADPRFVNYQFQSSHVRAYLEPRIRTTAGQSGINGADLRSVPLALPPCEEQRRIVDLLEDHLSRLDAARRWVGQARIKLDALVRSSLEAQFSGDNVVPLSELIDDIAAGKSFGGSNAPAKIDEWGIIKVSAMTWGEFRPDENKAVPASKVDPRFEIRQGDLLISRANTADYVGASVLVRQVRPRLLLSDKSLRITPKAGVSTEWFWRALQSPSARAQITKLATGTKESMRNISQSSLRRVLVPVADASKQVSAVATFDSLAVSSKHLRAELVRCEARYQALRRSLFSAAFSERLTGG
jgi:type I restriction enzyme S subunit